MVSRTDLKGRAEALYRLYGQWMSVEELFWDNKNRWNGRLLQGTRWWNGWSPQGTRIRYAERFDRLLLILALAY